MLTLSELNTYYEIVCSINKTQEMIDSLRDVAGLHSPALTGMPRASGIKDKVGDLAVEIADCEARIEFYKAERERYKQDVEAFVSGIEDVFVRMIFRLRFEHGLPWRIVASVVGGGNSEENVKAACYRYLKKLSREIT